MKKLNILILTIILAGAVGVGYKIGKKENKSNQSSIQEPEKQNHTSATDSAASDKKREKKANIPYELLPATDFENNATNTKSSPQGQVNSSKPKDGSQTALDKLRICRSKHDQPQKIQCLKRILKEHPEFAPSHYLLATIYMNNANFKKSDRHFAKFWKHATKREKEKYNINVYTDLDSIKQTLRKMDSKDEDESRYPYKKINGHIVVQVLLNDKHKAHLLFDTGASVTLLSPGIARELQLEKQGTVNLNTIAKQDIEAKLYSLQSITFGPIFKQDIPVAIARMPDLNSSRIDGILGMDLLKDHSFKIDRSEQEIVF